MKHIIRTTKKYGIVGILLFVFERIAKNSALHSDGYSSTRLIYQLSLSYEDKFEVEDKTDFFIYDNMNNFLFRDE